MLKSRINKIIEAGANVILTTMGIDDTASKYMFETGCLGLRRIDKGDIHRIARLTGATVINTMATPEGEEVFESSFLGECDEVVDEAVGDNDFVFFKGCKKSTACTIVLRGPNEWMLDEVERYPSCYLGLFTTLSVWPREPWKVERWWLEVEPSTLLLAFILIIFAGTIPPKNRWQLLNSVRLSTSSPRPWQ